MFELINIRFKYNIYWHLVKFNGKLIEFSSYHKSTPMQLNEMCNVFYK